MNENEAYVFSVDQPTQWSLKPEHFWITGWFVAKNGVDYTDVRAFIDDVPFMGLFGLPRPDIAPAYGHWTHGRHPGFSFRLEPWAGARLIRLEILNENGDWAEFWRVPIRVRGKGESRRHRPVLPPPLVPLLLTKLIKHASFRPHLPRAAFTRRLVREFSALPLNALPNPPLHGVFENPLLIAHTQYDKLQINGWVFHETQPIRRLIATTDGISYNTLVHGLPRSDVPGLFPGFPLAQNPQFHGMIDISERAADPVPLTIFAELENGETHLCFTKRLYQWTCREKEHRMPPYDRGYYQTLVREVRAACRELKVRPGGLSFWRNVRHVHRLYRDESHEKLPWFAWQKNTPYAAWLAHNGTGPRLRRQFADATAALEAAGGAEISLVVDARGARPGHLERLAATVRAQIYPRWQLTFVLPADAAPELAAITAAVARRDPRIHVQAGAPGTDWAATLNAAATGGWLAFPAPSARLPEQALLFVAEAIHARPETELVYSDEDYMTETGVRHDPEMKCAWSPELVFSGRHPGNLLVLRRDLFDRAGGFDSGYPDVLPFALSLRLGEITDPAHVQHLPFILHHGAPAAAVEPGSPVIAQTGAALNAALRRRGLSGGAFQPDFASRARWPLHQVYWEADHLARMPVTIVIPTRDRCDLLERCIQALILTVDWRHVRLLIVDDFSRDEKTVRFLRLLQARTDLSCRVIRPDCAPTQPFNYSRLMNAALSRVDTPLILHLNNDVDALRRGWVEQMAGWFALPEVGVVGAKLLYPNHHVNHAGLIVGPHHGLADAPLAGLNAEDDAWFALHKIARNVSAVTGACLMTRTALYREFGGFNETELGVTYNDVDYCLRLSQAGHRVVYAPLAELWHWGSATRGTAYYENEHIAFVRKYPGYLDRFWSRQLVMAPPGLALDRYRYGYAGRAGALHLLLVTHNLNFEGAPLFLLEYARHLAGREGFQLSLIAAEDGPLRSAYEELGVRIQLVDRHPLHGARSEAEFNEQIGVMLGQLDLSGVDVVLCNTMACWWGVHLAAAAGRPSLLYIHESASIKRFFSTALRPPMHFLVRQAFRLATRVCFLCHATRAYFDELNDYDNFRLVSSWIDLPRITAFKQRNTRAALRRKHGYAEDEVIIANVGTVCERKGQHIFIRTIDYFLRHFRGTTKYRFLLVGGRPGAYQDSLLRDLDRLGLTGVVDIINETHDAYDFFRLADLFVCSSFEESFPRVLLEAMAFETPIVSTDVHGITEMVVDKAEACLLEPGNPVKFAKVMKTCLDQLRNGTSTAPMGYSKVVRAYHRDLVLPKHADMIREAFLDFDGDTRRRQPRRLSGGGDRFESSW